MVTPEVRAAIDAATDIVGYIPYVARVAPRPGLTLHPSDNRVELDRAIHALQMAQQGQQVVVVSSGDPGVFAMASAVFEAMEGPPACRRAHHRPARHHRHAGRCGGHLARRLGHDFCAINLSDNLKPCAVIERRLRLAAEADFAMAFYNPRSASRPEGFARVLDTLRDGCEPTRLISFARAVSTPDQHLQTVTLAEARPEMADMRTVVIVGNSATRRIGRYVYTPAERVG